MTDTPERKNPAAGAIPGSRKDSKIITEGAVLDQFRAAMLAAGIDPPDKIIGDGQIHDFPTNGKKGDDAGRYLLHLDGVPNGWFQDHRQHAERIKFSVGDELRTLSREEAEANRRRIAEQKAKRDADKKMREQEAATLAARLLSEARIPTQDHPYLHRKKIPSLGLSENLIDQVTKTLGYHPKARGEPLQGRILIAPILVGDRVTSCELIDEAGRKSAIANGVKRGGSFVPEYERIADIPALHPICIGEGIATVMSVKSSTGWPVVAALSSGNLENIARAVRTAHPSARIILLADIDKKTGSPDSHAVHAASVVGGLLAVPSISLDKGKDWNDAAVCKGADAVRAALYALIKDSGNPCNPIEQDVTPEHTGDLESPIPGQDQRPKFVVLDDWVKTEARNYRPGVWFFGVKFDKQGNPELTETRACSPLHIDAVTHDQQEGNFGRLLRFQTTNGKWVQWAMPCELLAGDGNALRAELLSMGVELEPQARTLFLQYLNTPAPKRRVYCALSTGWMNNSFVLPDGVIGPNPGGVIFQSGERNPEQYATAGTLDGWQREIAALAIGNPLLIFSLSTAFVGPLLDKCHAESAGVHLVGDSSTGKSTALVMARSVWGGKAFQRSWRATANGLESVATLHNDALLPLDEISECDPREISAAVYMLANGTGKTRASRTGSARITASWRTFVLSTGERSLATSMKEGGYTAKAGQSIRFLDIPAARASGVFDELHGFQSGAQLSDALKSSAKRHHGHPIRAFLQRLTSSTENIADVWEKIKTADVFTPSGADGQVTRAAGRFALIAMAGELATEYGVTGWPEGAALNAAVLAFDLWQSQRHGGAGNHEARAVRDAVAGFIDRHGDSRFSGVTDSEAVRNNRAGWWEDTPEGRVFLFNAEGMREALTGFDFKRGLDVLSDCGALPPAQAGGKHARSKRIGSRIVKLYFITAEKLGGDDA